MSTEAKQGQALLARKRLDRVWNRYKVAAICSICGHVQTVWFARWSAIVCQGCRAELNRTKYGEASK